MTAKWILGLSAAPGRAVIGAFAAAEPPAQKQDVWAPLRFLAGAWTGTGKGQSGESQVERTYEFVLGGTFLQAKNKSVYAPTDANSKGETHKEFESYSESRLKRKK